MPGRISKERNQYFIRLERGTLCEVSREVYLCWYAGERQERYQIDRDRRNGVFSLDAISDRMFQENGSCFEEIIGAVIYTIAIFSFIKAAFKFEDKFSFGVIFCMLIMSLSTSIYTFKPYFNIMLFIIIMQNMQSTCNNDAQTNPGEPQQGGI